MNPDLPTPRTDSYVRDIDRSLVTQIKELVPAHFARGLERELITAKVHLADANKGARINALVNLELTRKNAELKAALDLLK